MDTITKRIHIIRLVFILIIIFPAVGKAAENIAGDWTSFRGNTSNNAVTNAVTPQNQKNTVLKWKCRLTKTWGIGTPIISGDHIFIASNDKLYKLDMNGKIITSVKMVSKIGYFSYSAAGDGKVFVPISDGRIQAFALSTMKSLWVSDKLAGEQTISPVLYNKGYVYFGTAVPDKSGSFLCLDAQTGHTIWNDTQGNGYYWCGGAITPNAVIFGGDDGVIVSHALKEDTIIDIFPTNGAIRSTAVYVDGNIFITSKDGYLYSIPVNADGTFGSAKKKKIGESTCTPAVVDEKVYVGAGRNFYILNSNTLSEISCVKLSGVCQSSALVSTAYKNNIAYISYNKPDGGGVNAVFDNGSKSVVTELVNPIPAWCTASIITDKNGVLYYVNDAGYLFAVDTVKVPSVPTHFKAKPKSGHVKLSWKKVKGADGYCIYRSFKKYGSYKSISTIKKKRSFTDKTIPKKKKVYYKIKAYKQVNGKKIFSGYTKIKKA